MSKRSKPEHTLDDLRDLISYVEEYALADCKAIRLGRESGRLRVVIATNLFPDCSWEADRHREHLRLTVASDVTFATVKGELDALVSAGKLQRRRIKAAFGPFIAEGTAPWIELIGNYYLSGDRSIKVSWSGAFNCEKTGETVREREAEAVTKEKERLRKEFKPLETQLEAVELETRDTTYRCESRFADSK